MNKLTKNCLFAFIAISFASCKPPKSSAVEASKSSADSFQTLGKALAASPLTASVSILDTQPRQLYKNNLARLSYPAGTTISISLVPGSPVELKFQQLSSQQKYHGVNLDLFANNLRYRIYDIKYDPQKGQFGIQTDPTGLNISSFFMAGALNWFVAPQIPASLKQKALVPKIANIRGLIADSRQFIEKFVGAPGEGKDFSLSSLTNLSMDATLDFPRLFRIRSGNAQIEFAPESFVNVFVFTSGSILKPIANRVHFTFSDLQISDAKSQDLLSFTRVGWIKDAIVEHGGKTTVHLKTPITEETLNLVVRNHKFVLQNNPNPTHVQRLVESIAQELLPILMPLVRQIDAAVPEVGIMESAGL